MLDNFREWLSDNLRYILLGLAILIVLLLLFFGIRALTGKDSGKEKKADKRTEQGKDSVDSDKSEKDADKEEENTLKKNANPEVTELIESFYTAWGQKDVAKMKELTDSFDTTDETKVTNAVYIEEYRNVEVYTKKGMDDDSYVVFASYELKFADVETAAPGLSELYVVKGDDGKYVIHNDSDDEIAQECIEKTRLEADVQELISEVEEKFNDALASDESLRNFEQQLGEKANTALMADNGDLLTAAEDCNVYTEADVGAEVLGRMKAGEQIIKLENASDNWIKVEYDGEEGYVDADMFQ